MQMYVASEEEYLALCAKVKTIQWSHLVRIHDSKRIIFFRLCDATVKYDQSFTRVTYGESFQFNRDCKYNVTRHMTQLRNSHLTNQNVNPTLETSFKSHV